MQVKHVTITVNGVSYDGRTVELSRTIGAEAVDAIAFEGLLSSTYQSVCRELQSHDDVLRQQNTGSARLRLAL